MANPFYIGPGGPVYMVGGNPNISQFAAPQMPVAPPPKQPPQISEEKLQEKGEFNTV